MNKYTIMLVVLLMLVCTPLYSGTHTFQIAGKVDTCINYNNTIALVINIDTEIGDDKYVVICPSNMLSYCMYNSIGDTIIIDGVMVKQNSGLLLKQELRLRATSLDVLLNVNLAHFGC